MDVIVALRWRWSVNIRVLSLRPFFSCGLIQGKNPWPETINVSSPVFSELSRGSRKLLHVPFILCCFFIFFYFLIFLLTNDVVKADGGELRPLIKREKKLDIWTGSSCKGNKPGRGNEQSLCNWTWNCVSVCRWHNCCRIASLISNTDTNMCTFMHQHTHYRLRQQRKRALLLLLCWSKNKCFYDSFFFIYFCKLRERRAQSSDCDSQQMLTLGSEHHADSNAESCSRIYS